MGRYVIRGGHSPRCVGAKDLLDEQPYCRNIARVVANILRENGHTVYLLESNESDKNADLRLSKQWADKYKPDLFASIHMNDDDEKKGYGSEYWIYSSSKTFAKNIGDRYCRNMNALGFSNRGMKTSTGLYELRATSCPAIIFETMFVGSKKDKDLWDKNTLDDIARAIANGIDPKIPLHKQKEEPKYRVMCYGMSEERAKEACDRLRQEPRAFKCYYERM